VNVTGIDGCRGGWVAVTVAPAGGQAPSVRSAPTLAELGITGLAGIDMPLGLLGRGWRTADAGARRQLGRRGSTVFSIAPRAVWDEPAYPDANRLCRELTGRGLSVQAWGLRTRLLEADLYRRACGHPLHEVHPELAFASMAGAPLPDSKHTAAGRSARRALLTAAGIDLPPARPAGRGIAEHDLLDAAAVAWSARRIAAGTASVLTDPAQRGDDGSQIAIWYLARPRAVRQAVAHDNYITQAPCAGQPHRVTRVVRVAPGQGEPGGARVANEERGYGQAQLVRQGLAERLGQYPRAAFDKDSRHVPFRVQRLENFSQGQAGAPVDDRGTGAGEEAGRRVQVAAGGERHPQRVRRQAAGHAGGDASRRADQEPGVVSPDRPRPDEDRIHAGAQLINLVQVMRAGQDQPVRRGVIQAAVNRDRTAHDGVRAVSHDRQPTALPARLHLFRFVPWSRPARGEPL
jgi:predicted RNase H-like nuclease